MYLEDICKSYSMVESVFCTRVTFQSSNLILIAGYKFSFSNFIKFKLSKITIKVTPTSAAIAKTKLL